MTRSEFTLCPDRAQLQQLLSGQTSDPEFSKLEAHLLQCDRCSQEADALIPSAEVTAMLSRAETQVFRTREAEQVEQLIRKVRTLHSGTLANVEQTLIGAGDAGAERTPQETLLNAGQTVAVDASAVSFLRPAQQPDEIGRLGGYRILQILGSGGMGVVFRAEDLKLKRQAALKVMKPEIAANLEAKVRFLREAEATAAIEHDNIVTIYQVAEDNGVPFIAMQLLKGESLQQRIARERKLEQSEVIRIGREIADGLQAAHSRALIHRDIKPDNIWLQEGTGRVRILDFGLARNNAEETGLTQSGIVLGTPKYMAPEQAQGENLDARADLFSLGSVLYRIASGAAPFEGFNLTATLIAVAHKEPQPLSSVAPDLHPRLAELINRLLSKNPADRPTSAADVASELRYIETTIAQNLNTPLIRQFGSDSVIAGEMQPLGVSTEQTQFPRTGQLPPFRSRRTAFFLAGFAALVLLAVLVIKLRTKEGLVVIELDSPVPVSQVEIDGREVKFTTDDSGRVLTVAVSEGTHELALKSQEGVSLTTELGTRPVQVALSKTTRVRAWLDSAPENDEMHEKIESVTNVVSSPSLDQLRRIDSRPNEANHTTDTMLAGPVGATVEVVGIYGRTGIDWGGRILEVFQSRSGDWWAIRGEDGVTHILDGNGKVTNRFTNEFEWVRGISADNLLMTVANQHVRFRDPGTGDEKLAIPVEVDYLSPIPDKVFEASTPALGPDGLFLATPANDGVVTIWDARTGVKQQTVKTGDKQPRSLALGPKGKTLATGDPEGVIRIWDVASGKSSAEHKVHQGAVTAIAFSVDGSQVASGGSDRAVFLLNAANITSETTPLFLDEDSGLLDIGYVEFSPDGSRLLACARSHNPSRQRVRVWNVQTRQTESLGESPFVCNARVAFARATFTHDGNQVATAGARGEPCIVVREIGSGRSTRNAPALEEPGQGVRLSADGTKLALSTDRGVTVWDTVQKKILFSHEHALRPSFLPDSLDMNKDGTHIVFRSSEGSGDWLLGVVNSGALKPLETSEGCEQRIAFSQDGQHLVGIGWQAITLWDSETRRITRRLTWESLGQKTHSASTVALLRDNRTALVGCKPFSVLQIDLAEERVLRKFTPGANEENEFLASALAVSADERIVAAACSHPFTPVVHAWEIQSGARAWEYSSRGFGLEGAYHLSFSGDGLNLAVSNRGAVDLLDAKSGRLIESQRLSPPDQGKHGEPRILGTSFTADGRYYATANGCGGAYLIRLR